MVASHTSIVWANPVHGLNSVVGGVMRSHVITIQNGVAAMLRETIPPHINDAAALMADHIINCFDTASQSQVTYGLLLNSLFNPFILIN